MRIKAVAVRLVVLTILLLPLIEIALFIVVGQHIGLWPTLLLIVLAAVLGGMVIRWQGLAALGAIRAAVERGELPARQIADAMLIAVAGLLLVLPGFFTDVLGLLLLIPALRGAIYSALKRRMRVVGGDGQPASQPPPRIKGAVDLDSDEWRER